jgi:hypothetical protein
MEAALLSSYPSVLYFALLNRHSQTNNRRGTTSWHTWILSNELKWHLSNSHCNILYYTEVHSAGRNTHTCTHWLDNLTPPSSPCRPIVLDPKIHQNKARAKAEFVLEVIIKGWSRAHNCLGNPHCSRPHRWERIAYYTYSKQTGFHHLLSDWQGRGITYFFFHGTKSSSPASLVESTWNLA